jgi:glycerate kinase
MKVVIAPDSFKDALASKQACACIGTGLQKVQPGIHLDLCPIADGGEGFTQALTYRNPHADTKSSPTFDPLDRGIVAPWVLVSDREGQPRTAIIELAAASGLERLERYERDPMLTTTFGTGVLIRDALNHGVKRIILGIGGSATNDAGVGIAQAFDIVFRYPENEAIPHLYGCGQVLSNIEAITTTQLPAEMDGVELLVACDVENPLAGPNGAAHVYAPQKGATPEQAEELDAGLRHIAQLWRDTFGIEVEHMPGAGAAGGVGGGLVAMLGAELVPGAELVLDTIGFDERIKDADLVITGEGRLDSQSLQGKAAMAVAKRCQKAGVPCVALVGSVGEGAEQALNHGLSAYHVIGEGLPAEESIRRTGELLEAAAVKLAHERLL